MLQRDLGVTAIYAASYSYTPAHKILIILYGMLIAALITNSGAHWWSSGHASLYDQHSYGIYINLVLITKIWGAPISYNYNPLDLPSIFDWWGSKPCDPCLLAQWQCYSTHTLHRLYGHSYTRYCSLPHSFELDELHNHPYGQATSRVNNERVSLPLQELIHKGPMVRP